MRKLFITVVLSLGHLVSHATETFSYFVYCQTTYIQGSWIREEMLKPDNYYFLQNKEFTDNFSISGDGEDMAIAIVGHLKEENPDRYNFAYLVKLEGRVVIFSTKKPIPDFDIIKNELTASMLLNGFGGLKIVQGNKSKSYKLQDISVPYMDLVMPPKK